MVARKRTLAQLFGKDTPAETSTAKKQKIVYDTNVTESLETETLDRSLEHHLAFDKHGRIAVSQVNLATLYPPILTEDPSGMRGYYRGGNAETYIHNPDAELAAVEPQDWSWRFNFKKKKDARDSSGRKIRVRMKNNYKELVPLYEFPLLSRLYEIGSRL